MYSESGIYKNNRKGITKCTKIKFTGIVKTQLFKIGF